LLTGLLLLILTVSIIPLQGDTPVAGNGEAATEEGMVTATSLPPGQGLSDPAQVEAFPGTVIPAAMARYNVPGSVVAVVNEGRLVIAKESGYNNLVNWIPIDANTKIFRTGSPPDFLVDHAWTGHK